MGIFRYVMIFGYVVALGYAGSWVRGVLDYAIILACDEFELCGIFRYVMIFDNVVIFEFYNLDLTKL